MNRELCDIEILICYVLNRQFVINEDCLTYSDQQNNTISKKEILDNIETVQVLAIKRLADGEVFKLNDFITEQEHKFSTQIGEINLIVSPGWFIDKDTKLATKITLAQRIYLVTKEYLKLEYFKSQTEY